METRPPEKKGKNLTPGRRQSKMPILSGDSRSSIVDNVFDCRLSGANLVR